MAIFKLELPVKPLENRNWLPDTTQLDNDQIKVSKHPFTTDLLVMGSAGTGKTVLAKLRFDALKKMGKNGKIVAFGNIFKSFLKNHVGGIDDNVVGAFELPKALAGIKFGGDFQQTAKKAELWSLKNRDIYDFLIIDEVQDLHIEHLKFCSNIAKRLYLFGDDAQQYYDHGNKIGEIIKALNDNGRKMVSGKNVIEITKNYRNQPVVAKIAQPFYSFAPANFPAADLEGAQLLPNLYHSKNYTFAQKLIDQIKFYINSQVGVTPTIGILCQSSGKLTSIKNLLKQQGLLVNEVNPDNAFSDARPILMTMQSSKGMEFDYVILVDVNYKNLKNTHSNNHDKIIFVALTRARKSVSVFLLSKETEFISKFNDQNIKTINL